MGKWAETEEAYFGRSGIVDIIGKGGQGGMRKNLKKARKEKGLTQQQVADYLHTDVRYYKQIENGERLGSIKMWDTLEDLFSIHQRILREISEIHPGKANNQ